MGLETFKTLCAKLSRGNVNMILWSLWLAHLAAPTGEARSNLLRLRDLKITLSFYHESISTIMKLSEIVKK